jgi:hypothetical protein
VWGLEREREIEKETHGEKRGREREIRGGGGGGKYTDLGVRQLRYTPTRKRGFSSLYESFPIPEKK